ncbi:MAG: glycosyltransferase [Azonexus sp.]
MPTKRLLMIAYHFPPLAGSSGIQRTLRFVQHLPDFGWEPLVLTADPMAYETTSDDLLAEIPEGTVVSRSLALDTARHLSIGGRYFSWMAQPDRWMSWKYSAVREGLKMIQQYRPDAIWSTYPIATAHLIGAELCQKTNIPWIADFRDPMAQDGYPADPRTWRSFKRVEEQTVKLAKRCLFTTPGAARMYRDRYPQQADRMAVLENGYDEASFSGGETREKTIKPLNPGCLTVLHSGIVYPEERDPRALFVALARLRDQHIIKKGDIKIRFRAAVHEELLHSFAAQYDVSDFVEVCGPLPYREALAEMLQADALLILQASSCNEQIPAKIYEYLRARRPIMALTDPQGDTASVLRNAAVPWICPLDDAEQIAASFGTWIPDLKKNRAPVADYDTVQQCSRRGRCATLAGLLNSLSD